MKIRRRIFLSSACRMIVTMAVLLCGTSAYGEYGPGRVPVGKGVFIGGFPSGDASIDTLGRILLDSEIGWIAIQSQQIRKWDNSIQNYRITQNVNPPEILGRSVQRLRNLDERLRRISIYIWAYPQTSSIDRAYLSTLENRIFSAAYATNANGIIIDPEREFRLQGNNANANEMKKTRIRGFAEGLRTRANGARITLGLTTVASFRGSWDDFPYDAFSGLVDFGMPQIYDRCDYIMSLNRNWPREVVRQWQGFQYGSIVPLSGLHHIELTNGRCITGGSGREKHREEICRLLLNTPVPDGAIGWWSYNYLSSYPELQTIIRQYPTLLICKEGR